MPPAPSLIPSVTFHVMRKGKPSVITSKEIFSAKNVALFGLIGAFTPSSHYNYLPGIIEDLPIAKENGTDLVAVTSVNDVYVLDAWARAVKAPDELLFLADGNGDFARALDLLFDGRRLGLGYRSKRYSMWVNNGSIQHLSVEADPTLAEVSTAHSLLKMFDHWTTSRALGSTFD